MADRGTTRDPDESTTERVSTGLPGLDEVLHGGLIPRRSYLVRGDPGVGKTILGLHYLTAGVEAGETVLFVNLEETTTDVRTNARTLGFDLEPVNFLDLSPESDVFAKGRTYDVFTADEVDGRPITETIADRIETLEPDRVFFDPLSQLRNLTTDEFQFRKQVLSFTKLLRERGSTVLFTTQPTAANPDDDLQFLSDGTIVLERTAAGRTLSVPKFRGSAVTSGEHGVRIGRTGMHVYPRIEPEARAQEFEAEVLSSGVPELDDLLGGGIERGTVSVLAGPTGAGKTTTGTQLTKEAARRGSRSVVYLFEESRATFVHRSEAIGIPITRMMERGRLHVEEVEPMRLSPQEFAQKVTTEVEEKDARIVMIDGVVGYQVSLHGNEEQLNPALHSLARYLKNAGVTVILVDEVPVITGEFRATDVGLSYLADNVVFLRHLEFQGELRKVIGVLKKRTSDFERTLREFEITGSGIQVGEPLTQLRGILSGAPSWEGDQDGRRGGDGGPPP